MGRNHRSKWQRDGIRATPRISAASERVPLRSPEEVLTFLEEARPAMEAEAGCAFTTFTPVECAKQVVAGLIYFVKVDIGAEKAIHVRILKPLPHTKRSMEIQAKKDMPLSAPLEHFS